MDRVCGWRVTGFLAVKGETAECKVGTFPNYVEAKDAGEHWAKANGRRVEEYHLDPVYTNLIEEESQYDAYLRKLKEAGYER